MKRDMLKRVKQDMIKSTIGQFNRREDNIERNDYQFPNARFNEQKVEGIIDSCSLKKYLNFNTYRQVKTSSAQVRNKGTIQDGFVKIKQTLSQIGGDEE